MRGDFGDPARLDAVLTRFVSYQPPEVTEFHQAIKLFSQEVGGLAGTLRSVISDQLSVNSGFAKAMVEFLELCKQAINPKVEMADAREMVIQHVLTEDIFMRVFDEAEFHRENVIARKLAEVAGTFYKGDTKRNIHAKIAPYYETINARAAQISDHHEKQKFLKALYENFYKAYNPKAADRLGIVYTPDEIVRFMIESADHLVFQHFGKTLGDRGVEILDPATGTGTFITELIETLPLQQLEYKYANEIHCNEVAILPYYIANLNIEYTYKQRTGKFKEFEHICFVDTLDNVGFVHTGKQLNFFGMITNENAVRITEQNSRKISVVIGNPPYNAWQENFNNQNANRAYPEIDKRIKETYIKQGLAQNQIALYDMYVRFLRWTSDRLDKNGVVAFISNSSFVDSRTFDGFRKVISQEFNEIYIVDLKGNARTSGEQRRKEGGNVFNDQIKVGVAIYFMIRREGQKGFKVFYNAVEDYASSENKRDYLREHTLADLTFTTLSPDSKNNWTNITDNDWDDLTPLISKDVKSGLGQKAIFAGFSRGVETTRDEWVYDLDKEQLQSKVDFFISTYNKSVEKFIEESSGRENDYLDTTIKWSSSLLSHFQRKEKLKFQSNKIYNSYYRPYIKTYLYFGDGILHRYGLHRRFFPKPESENKLLWVKAGSNWSFFALAIDGIPDVLPQGGSQCLGLYLYAEDGTRVDNITDWALGQFKKRYGARPDRFSTASLPTREADMQRETDSSSVTTKPVRSGSTGAPGEADMQPETVSSGVSTRPDRFSTETASSGVPTKPVRSQTQPITKLDIFHYVYAVLHHPAYRAKYEINLKREFPRIPFYEDFWKWAEWGQRLMDLHLGYEGVEGWGLERVDSTSPLTPLLKAGEGDGGGLPSPALGRGAGGEVKTRLMARKEKGEIEIDSVTTLRGVPPEAWEYRLGTYSALEWILERYKEKKPKDPTIAEKFNTYRFAEYKEEVIGLLGRVCRVSVETMRVIKEMPEE